MTGLKLASLFLILFAVIIIVWGIAVVHTLPGKVAKKRHHSQTDAIEIMSYLGLLVFPLWMGALIWSYLEPFKLKATMETKSDSETGEQQELSATVQMGDDTEKES
jgi:hypothetical protein